MAGEQQQQQRRQGRKQSSWDLGALDRSLPARELAGPVGLLSGVPIGAVRGAGNAARGLWDGAGFAVRLADPTDGLREPPGQSAQAQALRAGQGILAYAVDRAQHPEKLGDDARNTFHKWRADLDPTATPAADTASAELGRTFKVGMNDGELLFNVASVPFGGEAADATRVFGAAPKMVDMAKVSPELASYWAEPYLRPGHHALGQRFYKEHVGRFPVLKAVGDSPLNTIRGKTNGEMANLHFGVDDHFYGGRLPDRAGAPGWSGRKLGMQRYGPLARFWFGTPRAVKTILGGADAGGGLLAHANANGGGTQ